MGLALGLGFIHFKPNLPELKLRPSEKIRKKNTNNLYRLKKNFPYLFTFPWPMLSTLWSLEVKIHHSIFTQICPYPFFFQKTKRKNFHKIRHWRIFETSHESHLMTIELKVDKDRIDETRAFIFPNDLKLKKFVKIEII